MTATTPRLKLPYPTPTDPIAEYPAVAAEAFGLIDSSALMVEASYPEGGPTFGGPRLGNWELTRGNALRIGNLVTWMIELKRIGPTLSTGLASGDIEPNVLCFSINDVKLRPTGTSMPVQIVGTRFVGGGHVDLGGDVYFDAFGNGSQTVANGLSAAFTATYAVMPRAL